MTHRQFLVWTKWLELEWNRPDRHDFYQMSSAMESRRGYVKNPRKVKLEHMRLQFGAAEEKKPMSRGHAAAVAKAKWIAFVGAPVKQVTEDMTDELRDLERRRANRSRYPANRPRGAGADAVPAAARRRSIAAHGGAGEAGLA